MHFIDTKGILTASGGRAEHGILCEPEDCFRFMQELPERFPQMSLFDP